MFKTLLKNEKFCSVGRKVLLAMLFMSIVLLFIYWMVNLVFAVMAFDWLRAILSAIFAGIMLNKIIRELIEWSRTAERKQNVRNY